MLHRLSDCLCSAFDREESSEQACDGVTGFPVEEILPSVIWLVDVVRISRSQHMSVLRTLRCEHITELRVSQHPILISIEPTERQLQISQCREHSQRGQPRLKIIDVCPPSARELKQLETIDQIEIWLLDKPDLSLIEVSLIAHQISQIVDKFMLLMRSRYRWWRRGHSHDWLWRWW